MHRNFWANTRQLLTNPQLAWDFISYTLSKIQNQGQAVRHLYGGVEVTSFSGFSEYHSCAEFLDDDEYAFLTRYPLPEGDILDVGANLGIVSLLLARRFTDRNIHAFEPNPSTVRALRVNIQRNEAQNVVIQDVFVGSEKGEVQFHAHPTRRGRARKSERKTDYVKTVPSVTLDKYAEENSVEEVSLLKVDV